jgi:anionic cell wall polymer biosynthesis LytR-Cps2A-Psr (LCP) family protein
MSPFPDDKPPRVAFGMYKRFAIAGVLITLLTAGTVASAGLLEVKDLVSVIRDESQGHVIPGLKGALDDVPAGKPQTILVLGSDRRFVDIKQDNPARSDTMMLVRWTRQGATAVMNIPRDLKVPIRCRAGASTRRRSTPPTTAARRWRSRPSQPAAHPDQPSSST